ncbi:MAG: helix-turn-helix domain-containing protein [Elusimicrobiota bacterium]|jgi:transcriptional regulator with XRE-family HTH domain|nr:helix-turn-helix domain-containing protein [Elusimicrobiota bacterium]
MKNYSHIGKKIIEVLAVCAMTQTELAQITGIQFSVINRIINGKTAPSAKTLGKIAKALQQPVSYFTDASIENINGHSVNNSVQENQVIVNTDIEFLKKDVELLKKEMENLRLTIELIKKQ